MSESGEMTRIQFMQELDALPGRQFRLMWNSHRRGGTIRSVLFGQGGEIVVHFEEVYEIFQGKNVPDHGLVGHVFRSSGLKIQRMAGGSITLDQGDHSLYIFPPTQTLVHWRKSPGGGKL